MQCGEPQAFTDWAGLTNAEKNEICNRPCSLALWVCILDFAALGSVPLKCTFITKVQGKFQEACGKMRSDPISVLQHVKSGMSGNRGLKFYIIFSYVSCVCFQMRHKCGLLTPIQHNTLIVI